MTAVTSAAALVTGGQRGLGQAIIDALLAAGGSLVSILSVQSFTAGAGIYGASKSAAWSITSSLRGALAGQGTQVLGAHLSYTDTGMIRDLDVVRDPAADIARQLIDGQLRPTPV